ncbi:hypothetical protein [Streptomyces sp. AA1529]|uniref:hypothetical protein n=1 Tax=Streptomyces sp. AA1529 TaxID=1203257 RepID=UPI003D757AF3
MVASATLLAWSGAKFPRLPHPSADQGYRVQGFLARVHQKIGITIQITQRKVGGFRSTWAKVDAPPREVLMFAMVPR